MSEQKKLSDEDYARLLELVSPSAWMLLDNIGKLVNVQGLHCFDLAEIRILSRSVLEHPNFKNDLTEVLEKKKAGRG